MAKKNKWMSRKEAWLLAQKLAKIYGNIQAVADKINTATSTIYKWGSEPNGGDPDVRITTELKELAVKEGLIKA